MSLRNGLFAFVGGIAITGPAMAAPEPPRNPLVEGREPNPVLREFYEPEIPVERYGSGPVVPGWSHFEQQAEFAGWVTMVASSWEILLDQLTFPLGTARMEDRACRGM